MTGTERGASSTSRPDPNCGNCNGHGCMDCACRVMHDNCVRDCPCCCPPPAVVCDVDTYVTAGQDEDGVLYFDAECNGGGGRDCGWTVDLRDSDHSVSAEGWPVLNAAHRAHSEKRANGDSPPLSGKPQ